MTIRPPLSRFALGLAAVVMLSRAQVAIESRPKPLIEAAPTLPKPNLRASSNLVLIPVAVVDMANHPVTGLEKENFRVFDDGVEQPISTFAMEDEPIALGMVYDHSNSVAHVLGDESHATHMFLKTSNPRDEYFLVIFSSKPQVAVPMTPSASEVGNRIFYTKSGGTTALYDGVILGIDQLKKSNLNRRALLIVSDGGENNSRYTKKELQRIIEENDALIYSIGFNTYDANFPLLKWMSELAGGRAFLANGAEFGNVAAKIALELRNRYVLGFSAASIPRDGKYHSVRIQLIPPHGLPPLKASWRQSYRAPSDADH